MSYSQLADIVIKGNPTATAERAIKVERIGLFGHLVKLVDSVIFRGNWNACQAFSLWSREWLASTIAVSAQAEAERLASVRRAELADERFRELAAMLYEVIPVDRQSIVMFRTRSNLQTAELAQLLAQLRDDCPLKSVLFIMASDGMGIESIDREAARSAGWVRVEEAGAA
jgi:hypothetical protein